MRSSISRQRGADNGGGNGNTQALPSIQSALSGLPLSKSPSARLNGISHYSYPSLLIRNHSPDDQQVSRQIFSPFQMPTSYSHLAPVSAKEPSNHPCPAQSSYWRPPLPAPPPPCPPSQPAETLIGMGALRTSVEALYKELTGKELTTVAFGKPQLGTFGFATRLLREWRKETYGIDEPPATVYFVGDTPESDIRGTNEYNQISETDWFSILVKTGIYQDDRTPRFPPRKICTDVLEAVEFAVWRELGADP